MGAATDIIELSLFPLNTVLFPGQLMPLHVFEERYRLMVRRCLAEDKPFGVVLIRQGVEVGGAADPHQVGTMARILESTHLRDGAMDLVIVGTERFRILQLLHDQPYLRAEIAPFPLPDPADPASVSRMAEGVRGQVARYIELIAAAAGLQIKMDETPTAPQQVGYLAAVAMQIDNDEKQTLLDSASLRHILAAERILLNRENALLAWMVAHKGWPESAQFGVSGMLLPN